MKRTQAGRQRAVMVGTWLTIGWLSISAGAFGQERLGRGPEPLGRVRESSSTLPPPVNLARPTSDPGFSAPSPSDSAHHWSYLAEQRRQEDPKVAIRRKAELKAAQRQARLAAQQWYGVSNARPTMSATPTMGGFTAVRVTAGPGPTVWRISDRGVVHELPR